MEFIVIGIDDSRAPHFSKEILEHINSNSIFSGGTRHHDIVKTLLPKGYSWINIVTPISDVINAYSLHKKVIIFASGDPLFYGFASTLKKYLPQAKITTYPYFNSLQILAHKLVTPYAQMHVVSLTGRAWAKLDEALISGKELIGVLTDNKEHTPQTISGRLIDYGFANYQICVGELLGNAQKERVREMSLEEACNTEFEYPNNIILKKQYSLEQYFGIPDNKFELLDGRVKMITKMPIRLATLSQLDLKQKKRFWDIGFCTGSISIEAKTQFPHLDITSFEIREECKSIIEKNTKQFHTPGIKVIIGDFCNVNIDSLDAPDAVFIGGHGGKLKEMITKLAGKINKECNIVFNSVNEAGYKTLIEAIELNNLEIVNQFKINIDNHNPITIIKSKLNEKSSNIVNL